MFQRCARYEHPLPAAMVFRGEMGTCAVHRQLNMASPRCGPLQALFSISGTVVNQRHGQAICLSTMEPCSVEGPLPNIRMRSSGFIGFARVCSVSGKRARAGRWTTSVAPTARVPENPCSGGLDASLVCCCAKRSRNEAGTAVSTDLCQD